MFKTIKKYFQKRFDRFYRPNRLHLVLDIFLIAIILILLTLFAVLNFYKPSFNFTAWTTPTKIRVDLNNPSLEINFNAPLEAIRPEESLPVELRLKNSGQADINDLKINLVSKNNNFSISKIETSSTYESDKMALSVEGSVLSVSEIPAGLEASISIKVYFKSRVKTAKTINWEAETEYYFDRQLFKSTIDLADIKVASKLSVSAAGYYNSPQGDQLGSGPLPPVVGLPTNFWVFLKAEPAGDFGEFVMSVKLPKNVTYTDSTSMLAGTLNYSPDSRQVIWQVDNLKEGEKDYRAGFEVQLIPTKEQAGKEAILLDNIKFKALDIFSDLQVEGSVPFLDTGLEHDVINKGEGKVLAE